MKQDSLIFVVILFILGVFLMVGFEGNISGAVIGVQINNLVMNYTGVFLIVCSLMIFLASQENLRLEEKLKQISDVKVRREFLSEAVRARKFAELGYDVNGCWNPKKNYSENVNQFLTLFYGEASEEIKEGYKKYLVRKNKFTDEYLKSTEFEMFFDKAIKTSEFEEFKEKAIRLIILWNEKVFSGEFVSLHIESVTDSNTYPGKMQRIVHYGPENLKEQTRNQYNALRKIGKVITAHEIINPEAIAYPNKLQECPHIHWELENIMKENYEFK